jgi:hypothetical protein
MTLQKESAGGYGSTTADTKIAPQTIAFHVRIKQAAVHLASMVAVNPRGLV